MIREPQKPILTAADIKPSREFLKVDGVFNCGVAKKDKEYILLCRVAESCAEQEEEYLCYPVFDEQIDDICIRKLSRKQIQEKYDLSDPRVIALKDDDADVKKVVNLTSLSHLRIARSRDGIHFTVDEKPAIYFSGKYERWGMEDPRITYLEEEERYCITYTAVSDMGVMPGLLITTDFNEFHRMGLILPPENKDVVIFPRKINNLYYACHRPVPNGIGTPDIWLASSPDLIHWGNHRHICGVTQDGWESGRIGSGAPPIYTEKGWLHIYHGADRQNRYCLGAMLTDFEQPDKIIAKTENAILEPEMEYETEGFFGNVVFSCGCLLEDGMLIIYYGAADDKIARAKISLEEVFVAMGLET